MGCLSDIKCGKRTIIGIRDYKECKAPESDLYINDAPGISLKAAAAIADSEYRSGYDLLNKMLINAVVFTFNDFIAEISSTFSYDFITEIRKINYFDGSTLGTYPAERGLVLKRWRSDMAKIYIEFLHLKVATSGTYLVKIIDGSETTEISVDLAADVEKQVRIDKYFDSENVKIVMDNTVVSVYSGQINKQYTGCFSCGGQNNNFYMSGWNGTQEEPTYFGIGVTAMVKCVEENLICKALPKMSMLFWYRAQMMYWDEALKSTRLNPIANFNKAQAEQAFEDAEDRFLGAYKAFIPTIKQLLVQTKGDCIKCNSSIKYANTIP